jgi:hypothetical protein
LYGHESQTTARKPGIITRSNAPPKPCQEIAKPSRKLLELELMHRWSTSTYKGFSTNAEELHLLQVELPRQALRFEFLLYGIYAISAVDMAIATAGETSSTRMIGIASPPLYVSAALEYYGKASAGFRTELSQLSRENHYAVWIFSLLIAVFHIALPLEGASNGNDECSILGRMITFFDLYGGIVSVTTASLDWLVEGSALARQVLALEPASLGLINDEVRTALGRLSHINEKIHNSKYDLYKTAITWLERGFAEDAKGVFIGFCFTWPAVLGSDFATALGESDHLAFLLLVHWAVLLHRLPEGAWWVNTTSEKLVTELSQIIWYSRHASILEWRHSILWIQQKVGLASLLTNGSVFISSDENSECVGHLFGDVSFGPNK